MIDPSTDDQDRDLEADLRDVLTVADIADHGHRADRIIRIITKIAPVALRRAIAAEAALIRAEKQIEDMNLRLHLVGETRAEVKRLTKLVEHTQAPERSPSKPRDDECPGHGRGGSGQPCCTRHGEYNGYGSDGPLLFHCPKGCSCHD